MQGEAGHSWSPRREKIAWRAMQEEQAEKRKAVAREEARACRLSRVSKTDPVSDAGFDWVLVSLMY